ncbi:MAG: hypothetical protein ACR2QR_09970 [Woeseiaceae bacterium]
MLNHSKRQIDRFLVAPFLFALALCVSPSASADFFDNFEWKQVNHGVGITWEARAGLQALKHRGRFYVLGGRAPERFPATFGDSRFFDDVWKSRDSGKTWSLISGGHGAPWAARAYFQAVSKGRYMYVLGGQDSAAVDAPPFVCADIPLPEGVPCKVLKSTFFNDVWRSKDGVKWKRMTANAAWSGRAGLSAVTHRGWIYVMGGSVNDDNAIIGPGGPPRIYYNDVYRSRDGRHWQKVTDAAPWAPRAGAVVVTRGRYMYVLGGEDGFICDFEDFTKRCPPYFNDVWRSRDGKHWSLVTDSAGWSPRPGHQCEVLLGTFVCFGGFGLSFDPGNPFAPSNPTDIWVSRNGAHWTQLAGTASPPWNAEGPADIKYDFAAFPTYWVNGRFQPSIFTFGGDRETFDPGDIDAVNKVDNDVWQFKYNWRRGRR